MKDTRRYTRRWYQAEPVEPPSLFQTLAAAAYIAALTIVAFVLLIGLPLAVLIFGTAVGE